MFPTWSETLCALAYEPIVWIIIIALGLLLSTPHLLPPQTCPAAEVFQCLENYATISTQTTDCSTIATNQGILHGTPHEALVQRGFYIRESLLAELFQKGVPERIYRLVNDTPALFFNGPGLETCKATILNPDISSDFPDLPSQPLSTDDVVQLLWNFEKKFQIFGSQTDSDISPLLPPTHALHGRGRAHRGPRGRRPSQQSRPRRPDTVPGGPAQAHRGKYDYHPRKNLNAALHSPDNSPPCCPIGRDCHLLNRNPDIRHHVTTPAGQCYFARPGDEQIDATFVKERPLRQWEHVAHLTTPPGVVLPVINHPPPPYQTEPEF